jgi:hypothetical protein
MLCLTVATLWADWRDDIGFTRLQLLAGTELPGAPSQGLTHVEALLDNNYAPIASPNTTDTAFPGKTFTLKSGTSAISWHATHVATNFYGGTSLIPGATGVDVYNADDWINSGFLNLGSFSVPVTETHAVQNHSWIVNTEWSAATVEEANRRLDYVINHDGVVCVVGENNGNSTLLPQFLGQTYHTISVGRADGAHSAGFTTFDGPGRIKPDLVAPSTAPENATSFTTPMVAGTAGLLVAKLAAAPYSLKGAYKPLVVKALLLAAATKNTVPAWSNTSTRPLDLRYGAGELNAWHAYSTLRSGKTTASNNTLRAARGWAAESVAANSTNTYFFNLPAGAPSTPFSAALTWHRKITKTGFTWSDTFANLNLRLYQASGFTLGNLVAASLSAVDNVELVYQSALVPGNYALVVENTAAATTSYGLAWHSLPAVTVAATTPGAREIDGQPGVITLIRTDDTTLPLYVPLSIGGTATPGTHYQTLPTSITIPAGLTTATLQVTPLADSLAQGDRTVSVAVAADFALVRDPAQTALVTIQDKPFDAWRFAHFTSTELSNISISGESADPDGDQLANLIEYALGLAPKSPSTLPVTMIDLNGYLALTANKNPAATDLIWDAEITANLATLWNPAVITTNTANTFEARDTVLKNAASKRFIRLYITRP